MTSAAIGKPATYTMLRNSSGSEVTELVNATYTGASSVVNPTGLPKAAYALNLTYYGAVAGKGLSEEGLPMLEGGAVLLR